MLTGGTIDGITPVIGAAGGTSCVDQFVGTKLIMAAESCSVLPRAGRGPAPPRGVRSASCEEFFSVASLLLSNQAALE